ncbi:hypothetical protein EJ06DRAFT_526247 [Trichodelitschia bisporula]|uniref:Uncharacterized protein n=1 Tax=Trichodelitschia bisporula TaxID=703511 RepID=A0A6G1I832_9PEZI|nr:hypothetical protein EJ06DRAFT_526247 [Trichodelitschia bisporula]
MREVSTGREYTAVRRSLAVVPRRTPTAMALATALPRPHPGLVRHTSRSTPHQPTPTPLLTSNNNRSNQRLPIALPPCLRFKPSSRSTIQVAGSTAARNRSRAECAASGPLASPKADGVIPARVLITPRPLTGICPGILPQREVCGATSWHGAV